MMPELDTPAQLPSQGLQAMAAHAYAAQSRETMEERWILDNLPLVRHIVQKVTANFSKRVDKEELISAGTLGLVKAARAYDSTRDAEFRTYAYIRVRGAIIDELRSRSFVPSAVHNQIRMIQEAFGQFSAVNGRPPSDEELAQCMGMSIDDLYTTMEDARRQHFLCINGLSDDQSVLTSLVPVDRSDSAEVQAERRELLEKLAKAIMEMPQRDRHVLVLYYERDLTMKEIAEVLGITESRVSQLHASALLRLSIKMKD